jgi:hypothetical protein
MYVTTSAPVPVKVIDVVEALAIFTLLLAVVSVPVQPKDKDEVHAVMPVTVAVLKSCRYSTTIPRMLRLARCRRFRQFRIQ